VTELTVKDGKLETFRELMEEMVSGARTQPGTLAYEWYISPDAGTVHVVETYADSAAVVAHHVSEGSLAELDAAVHGVCQRNPGRRLRRSEPGSPRDPRRLGASYNSPWGGFSRL